MARCYTSIWDGFILYYIIYTYYILYYIILLFIHIINVNLLHVLLVRKRIIMMADATYRYDPVHEDIVTHIRHRLLLCQHVGDVAKDDEKNWEDCSGDDCKHLMTIINISIKIYKFYNIHKLTYFMLNQTKPNCLNMLTTPKKRRSVSVLSRNL